jgi:hypothetical protein
MPGERRGGRQKGTPNKRTRMRLAQAAALEAAARAEGITPIELMINSMRMLWRQAHAGPGDPNRELVAQACGIARDVAPYLHPRLAAIAATATVTTVEQASPEEAQRLAMAALEKAFGVPQQIALSPATTGDIVVPAELQ